MSTKIANQNHMTVLACTIILSCSFKHVVLTLLSAISEILSRNNHFCDLSNKDKHNTFLLSCFQGFTQIHNRCFTFQLITNVERTVCSKPETYFTLVRKHECPAPLHSADTHEVSLTGANLIQKASYKQVDSLTMTNLFSKILFMLLFHHDNN